MRLLLAACASAVVLAVSGCTAAPAESVASPSAPAAPAPSPAAATKSLSPAAKPPPSSLPQGCSSNHSFGGNTEASRPSSREAARAYPQTPLDAARQIQTSPAYGPALSEGSLSGPAVLGTRYLQYVFAVRGDDGGRIGEITVRRTGFGAFAATEIQACVP
jgi:hypothetical protein